MTEAEFEQHLARKLAPPAPTGRAHLELPWPPTGNTNVRHGNGAHYLTAKHKAFRADVAVRVVVAGLHRQPLTGRLQVVIHASPPDKRHRDLDNVAKPVLDACQHAGLYPDDSAIDDLRILRIAGKPGTINVFVSEIGA